MKMPKTMCAGTRREFLWETGTGFTGLALASLLDDDGFFTKHAKAAGNQASSTNLLKGKPAQLPVKAKHCIFLFMYGGPSQMDLFDYKPELQKREGQHMHDEFKNKCEPCAIGCTTCTTPRGCSECSEGWRSA